MNVVVTGIVRLICSVYPRDRQPAESCFDFCGDAATLICLVPKGGSGPNTGDAKTTKEIGIDGLELPIPCEVEGLEKRVNEDEDPDSELEKLGDEKGDPNSEQENLGDEKGDPDSEKEILADAKVDRVEDTLGGSGNSASVMTQKICIRDPSYPKEGELYSEWCRTAPDGTLLVCRVAYQDPGTGVTPEEGESANGEVT